MSGRGFTAWLQKVDAILFRRVGVCSGDLPDACLHDWYDDGISPAGAAQLLIEAGP